MDQQRLNAIIELNKEDPQGYWNPKVIKELLDYISELKSKIDQLEYTICDLKENGRF